LYLEEVFQFLILVETNDDTGEVRTAKTVEVTRREFVGVFIRVIETELLEAAGDKILVVENIGNAKVQYQEGIAAFEIADNVRYSP
jgi:hypothetical protein